MVHLFAKVYLVYIVLMTSFLFFRISIILFFFVFQMPSAVGYRLFKCYGHCAFVYCIMSLGMHLFEKLRLQGFFFFFLRLTLKNWTSL